MSDSNSAGSARSLASAGADEQPAGPEGMQCDFCGDVVASVQRVALDGSYERLTTPHEVRYACSVCSARKERQRLGLERG